jgi:hypothetical protein
VLASDILLIVKEGDSGLIFSLSLSLSLSVTHIHIISVTGNTEVNYYWDISSSDILSSVVFNYAD